MKRFLASMILLLLPACAFSLSLSWNPVERTIRLSSQAVSFNSATGYVRGTFGPLRAGSLSGIRNIAPTLDSYSRPWPGVVEMESPTTYGLALSLEEASFYTLSYPSPGIGAALFLWGFEAGFAYFPQSDVTGGLWMEHQERGGLETVVASLGWSNDNFLVRGKLSTSPETGADMLLSLGLSWKGLAALWTGGRQANVMKVEKTPQQAWHLVLDSDRLLFHFCLEEFNSPVAPGSYRRQKAFCEAEFAFLDEVVFKGRTEAVFTETGGWESDVEFSLRCWKVEASWSGSDGWGLDISAGPLEFELSSSDFTVSYAVQGEWYRFRFSLSSDGSFDASVSVELS